MLRILDKASREKNTRAKKRRRASMAKSKSVVRKKTRRPTAAQHPVKSLRLPADLAKRVDRWAKAMGKDSHSEAMRHLLEIGLSAPKRKST
jgi:hypothetical protein